MLSSSSPQTIEIVSGATLITSCAIKVEQEASAMPDEQSDVATATTGIG